MVHISLIIIGFGIGIFAGLSVSPVASIIITSTAGLAAAVAGGISGVNIQKKDGKEQERPVSRLRKIKPLPIACLVFFIAVGAGFGVYARTHNWLGINIDDEIKKWEELGFDRQEVIQKFYNERFPPIEPRNRIKTDHVYLEKETKKWDLWLKDENKTASKRFFDIIYPEKEPQKNANPQKAGTGNGSLADSGSKASAVAGLFKTEVSGECDSLINIRSDEDFKYALENSNMAIFRGLPKVIDDSKKLREEVEKICKQLGE